VCSIAGLRVTAQAAVNKGGGGERDKRILTVTLGADMNFFGYYHRTPPSLLEMKPVIRTGEDRPANHYLRYGYDNGYCPTTGSSIEAIRNLERMRFRPSM